MIGAHSRQIYSAIPYIVALTTKDVVLVLPNRVGGRNDESISLFRSEGELV